MNQETEEKFGKFTILNVLGRGGMAEALRCRLSGMGGFDKVVVVKRILANLAAEPEFVDMFLEEARIAANLTHPNVVQIFEIDEIEGIPYISMEYVNGLTLSRLLRAAQRTNDLRMGHLAWIFADIADGLQYVHTAADPSGESLGLVHRDVSPQNIIVSTEGVAKLLDFGVAKGKGRLVATQSGVLKGKLRYMSPEHVLEEGELDQRSDIFSLAVCLFEATTQQSPFGKGQLSDLNLLKRIVEGKYTRPTEYVPGYPPMLEEVVMWALEPHREARCPSAEDFRQKLHAFCSTPPHTSSRREVAAWVQGLMVIDVETRAQATASRSLSPIGRSTPASRPSRPATSSRSSPSSSKPRVAPPADEAVEISMSDVVEVPPARTKLWVGIGICVAALAIASFVLFEKETPIPEPVASESAVTATAAATQLEAALAYLDEADRYLAAQKFGPASQMVQKARELSVQDVTTNIRITALSETIKRDTLLFKGAGALQERDIKTAISMAKQVLQLDPENQRAKALLADAQAQQPTPKPQPVKVAPSKRPSVSARPHDAKLSVSSNPPGVLYLDGESLGRTPIENLLVSAGPHRVQVRLKGYLPIDSEIEIVGGRDLDLAYPLVPEATAKPHPETAVEPVKVAVSSPPPAEKTEPVAPAVAAPVTATPAPASPEKSRKIPRPKLSSTYGARNVADVSRVFTIIENQIIETGLAPPEFTREVLGPLKGELKAAESVEIFPSAIYYFVIREALLGREREASATALRTFHRAGMASFRNLPSTPGIP